MKKNYLVATIKPWNIFIFKKKVSKLNGNWHLISNQKNLTYQKIKKINPQKIFFPHWSWRIPDKILNNFNCIAFHASNLPYGKGGSPIQNQILKNKKETYLSSFKITDKLDSGPIYYKKKLSLNGSASIIYKNSANIIYEMIKKIIKFEIKPKSQKGKGSFFKRNTNNSIKKSDTINTIYNKIRMLDAETYPNAFLKFNKIKIEFNKPKKKRNKIFCQCVVEKTKK